MILAEIKSLLGCANRLKENNKASNKSDVDFMWVYIFNKIKKKAFCPISP
jgi:hypothetical protein